PVPAPAAPSYARLVFTSTTPASTRLDEACAPAAALSTTPATTAAATPRTLTTGFLMGAVFPWGLGRRWTHAVGALRTSRSGRRLARGRAGSRPPRRPRGTRLPC